MRLFNLSRKTNQPYKDPGLNKIYELLFCDNIDLYKADADPSAYPWDVLLTETPDIDKFGEIVKDKTLESRQRLLAYNLLSTSSPLTGEKELLGVIVEVVLSGGLDVLAVYSDGSARYINHSGKFLAWETQTGKSDKIDPFLPV